jgi:prepilin-type processing-associated H-X9-DG protein
VVIGIIAALIAILLPALSGAREQAKSIKSLSNLRQLGLGLDFYRTDNNNLYPPHSSISTPGIPRTRWADYIYPYMNNTGVYLSPMLTGDERVLLNKPFAHSCNPDGTTNPQTIFYGGYGYNFQYLGNARVTPTQTRPFQANAAQIRAASQTIAIADTHGSKDGGTSYTSEGVYAIDPPLMSLDLGSQGARNPASFVASSGGDYSYRGGYGGDLATGTPGDPSRRATPAERNRGYVNVVFCDGHAEHMKLRDMDDFNGDGKVDNGYWNGKADVTVR